VVAELLSGLLPEQSLNATNSLRHSSVAGDDNAGALQFKMDIGRLSFSTLFILR
jgi:hypothetical protein